ncbi:DUF3558 family protein [Amycolatopsis sacchari]|uniref:DUF3558 domain-containing protein n=1 Tax=Amycolatopsis sacchari TaxID=115433 RepID=A0A1I3V897_9PSEU|nr:Protein of unknown function [Amycolatopsis sacchari]
MRRLAPLAAVAVAAVAVLLAGCSSEEPGRALPATSAPGSSSPVAQNALGSFNPCEALTKQDLDRYRVQGPGRTDDPPSGAAAWCRWTGRASDSASMVFGLTVRPQQGLADLTRTVGQLSDGTVNGRPARRLAGETGSSCTVALAVSAGSRVDVSAVGTTEVAEACTVASDLANIIEPKLPPYSG